MKEYTDRHQMYEAQAATLKAYQAKKALLQVQRYVTHIFDSKTTVICFWSSGEVITKWRWPFDVTHSCDPPPPSQTINEYRNRDRKSSVFSSSPDMGTSNVYGARSNSSQCISSNENSMSSTSVEGPPAKKKRISKPKKALQSRLEKQTTVSYFENPRISLIFKVCSLLLCVITSSQFLNCIKIYIPQILWLLCNWAGMLSTLPPTELNPINQEWPLAIAAVFWSTYPFLKRIFHPSLPFRNSWLVVISSINNVFCNYEKWEGNGTFLRFLRFNKNFPENNKLLKSIVVACHLSNKTPADSCCFKTVNGICVQLLSVFRVITSTSCQNTYTTQKKNICRVKKRRWKVKNTDMCGKTDIKVIAVWLFFQIEYYRSQLHLKTV